MSGRFWIFIAAILGGLAVAAGAIGSHALVDAASADAKRIFSTGQHYHALHALALLGVGIVLLQSEGRRARFATWFLQVAALAFLIFGRHLRAGRARIKFQRGNRAAWRHFIYGWLGSLCDRSARVAQLKQEPVPGLETRERSACDRLCSCSCLDQPAFNRNH